MLWKEQNINVFLQEPPKLSEGFNFPVFVLLGNTKEIWLLLWTVRMCSRELFGRRHSPPLQPVNIGACAELHPPPHSFSFDDRCPYVWMWMPQSDTEFSG